jgi:hypothetical protein
MKIVKLAAKKEITPAVMQAFITRFRPQLPGLAKYYNDPMFLKYAALLMQVFANSQDFVSFSFQLRKWLEKYDEDKKS